MRVDILDVLDDGFSLSGNAAITFNDSRMVKVIENEFYVGEVVWQESVPEKVSNVADVIIFWEIRVVVPAAIKLRAMLAKLWELDNVVDWAVETLEIWVNFGRRKDGLIGQDLGCELTYSQFLGCAKVTITKTVTQVIELVSKDSVQGRKQASERGSFPSEEHNLILRQSQIFPQSFVVLRQEILLILNLIT